MASSGDMKKYTTVERGSLYTLDYRVFFKDEHDKYVSPWHDIPLFADKDKEIYNMIVEIPRWTNAKMEMATKLPMSPIKQDVKKGLPRFVDNVFPHHGYIWNYGAFPQTWENPAHITPETKTKGDNDPIDVLEIGSKVHKRGDVVQVKVLGTLCLIDEGETDWKIMTIDITDPLADSINSVDDVEKYLPGLMRASNEWFRTYKIPAGKPANQFGFQGHFKDATYAKKIVEETNEFWRELIKEQNPALNTEAHVPGAAHPANDEAWTKIVESSPALGQPGEIPETLGRWHYISE
ncbi:hypothetical protein AB6A40_003321 [Gnathostoma spinigerum]|uniref:inorganic diphosphatase n=1 Tax=Gnathostoma spinigerum TaxID=75299 RepID=A0ABD6EJ81_9BILA